jgi:hypothetical protein
MVFEAHWGGTVFPDIKLSKNKYKSYILGTTTSNEK